MIPWTFILPYLVRYGLPLLLIASVLGWTYYLGYDKGKQTVKVQTITRYVEVKDAQAKAVANAPRSRADVIQRLRQGRF